MIVILSNVYQLIDIWLFLCLHDVLFLMLFLGNMVNADDCMGEFAIKIIEDNGTSIDAGINISNIRQYSLSDNILELTFDKTGKEKLAEITEKNVGKQAAIIYDDVEIMNARIQEPIKNGGLIVADIDNDNTEALLSFTNALKNAGVQEKPTYKQILLTVSIVIVALLVLLGLFKIFTSSIFKNCFHNTIGFICKPVFITSLISIFALCGVGFGIFKGIEAISLPACDSKFAENEVIEIFKQNNRAFKELDKWGMVSDIKMSMIVPESYKKEIKKYECSARLTLYPSNTIVTGIPSWIVPRFEFTGKGDFSSYRAGTLARSFWGYATCDVYYDVYKEHGKNHVTSSYCKEKLKYEDPLYLDEVVLE